MVNIFIQLFSMVLNGVQILLIVSILRLKLVINSPPMENTYKVLQQIYIQFFLCLNLFLQTLDL